MLKTRGFWIYIVIILVVLPLVFFISLLIGPYPLSFSQLLRFLLGQQENPIISAALTIRLHRTLLAAGAGAGLAISGATLQGLFRNPLIDSGLLGINSGAGFGAAIAILFTSSVGVGTFLGSEALIQGSSLFFALLALLLCFLISGWYRDRSGLVIVLAGVVISSLFSSLLTLIKFSADPFDKLPRIIFWLMGSFTTVTISQLIMVWAVILLGFLVLYLLRWRLTVISLGVDSAYSVGVRVRLVSSLSAVIASLIAASIVSICGIIGWAGLIVPHLARMIVGNDYRKLLPVSFFLGMLLLLLADLLIRLLSVEIPVTVVTSLIGVPFYLFLLHRYKLSGSSI